MADQEYEKIDIALAADGRPMKSDDFQSQVAPIWPVMKVLGFKTKSSAYAAAKHLPPEAFVQIGKLKRLNVAWLNQVTSGKPAAGDTVRTGKIVVPDMSDEPLLQFFTFDHLPKHLADVSARFRFLAAWITTELPRNPERTVALRKLLEAKDCAVRARLFHD